MSDPMRERIASAIGAEAVRREPGGTLHVTPGSVEAAAGVLGLAHDEGWRVALAGGGTWQDDRGPADLVLSTRGLDRVGPISAADLVVTAEGGVPLDQLRQHVLERGAWLPLDPPGRPERTLGSVLATATGGPLRHGMGPVREQVLGLTVVTGDGRVVRAGGTTVKNVAGFDLVKLHVGGFGGFGLVAAAHLRLRALPRADGTWFATGERDALTSAARALQEHDVDPVAVELLSPALAAHPEWTLAVRLAGGPDAVAGEAARLHGLGRLPWREATAEERILLWQSAARAVATAPVTIRLGVLSEGIDEAIDLVTGRLGEGMLSAGPVSGTLRWSGRTDADALRALRGLLAAREIPLTLERGPWPLRRALGHFGAYREGVGGLVSRLREAFDPRGTLLCPLDTGDAT